MIMEPLGFLFPIFGREEIDSRSALLQRLLNPPSDSEPEDEVLGDG